MKNNNLLKNSSLLNPDINRKVIGFVHHSFVFRRDRSYHLRRSCPVELKYCVQYFNGYHVFIFGYSRGRVHHYKTPIYE